MTDYIFKEDLDLVGSSQISIDFLDITELLNFSTDKHVIHYVASQNSHFETLILIPKNELTEKSIEVSEDFLESFYSKQV